MGSLGNFDSINSSPKVSFVVPTYNYARYLNTSIQSMLEQSYGNIEVVIVDDASSDDTPNIAREICFLDHRVRYLRHEKNIGPVNNWNACIQEASGDFVWLISADDVIASKDAVLKFLSRFRENPDLGFVFCRAQIIDGNGAAQEKWIPRRDGSFPDTEIPTRYPGKRFFKHLARANFVPVLGVMARRECYLKAGGFPQELVHCGDWYHWLRFSLHWDVFYEPEALVHYRQHTTNMSNNYSDKSYPIQNTLLCYQYLRKYIADHQLGKKALRDVEIAEVLFLRNKKQTLSMVQKLAYRQHKVMDLLGLG